MIKLARKPLSLQWGRRPNLFTCGVCRGLFRLRHKLEEHRKTCTKQRRPLLVELDMMKKKLGLDRHIPIVPNFPSPSQQQVFAAFDRVLAYEENPVGRPPHLEHACDLC